MKKKRILALMHKDLVPPDKATSQEREEAPWKTEFDVIHTLRSLKHEVRSLGVVSDLGVIRDTIDEFNPHIVFNLLEEFDGEAVFDQNIVSYLELKRVRYTGSGPHGLMIGRDKALSKKILQYHRIPVPRFQVMLMKKKMRRPSSLAFPLIVKSVSEEASLGISQASLVSSDERLKERVEFIHESVGTDAIVEQYIEGREIYVGLLGNERVAVLPPCELIFGNLSDETPRIATSRVKHNPAYRKKHDIDTSEAKLDEATMKHLTKICRRAYKNLYLCGYARLDLRIDARGVPYVLEANPNPDIAKIEDFAVSASLAGIPYERLIEKIVSLGLRYGKYD